MAAMPYIELEGHPRLKLVGRVLGDQTGGPLSTLVDLVAGIEGEGVTEQLFHLVVDRGCTRAYGEGFVPDFDLQPCKKINIFEIRQS